MTHSCVYANYTIYGRLKSNFRYLVKHDRNTSEMSENRHTSKFYYSADRSKCFIEHNSKLDLDQNSNSTLRCGLRILDFDNEFMRHEEEVHNDSEYLTKHYILIDVNDILFILAVAMCQASPAIVSIVRSQTTYGHLSNAVSVLFLGKFLVLFSMRKFPPCYVMLC